MKKQKIIKKLKKHSIWPHIVIMVIMATLFVVFNSAAFSMILYNMLGNKILDGYSVAEAITEIFNDDTGDTVIRRDIDNIRKAVPEIKAVCLVDKDNNVIKRIGEETPVFDREVTFLFSGNELLLLPDKDVKAFFIEEDGELSLVFKEILSAGNWKKLFAGVNDNSFKSVTEDWASYGLWYVLPCKDCGNRSCVKSAITISRFEAYCVIGMFVFIMIMGLLFGIYLLSELIKVVTDQRRAFRILNTDFVTLGNNRIFFMDYGSKLLRHKGRRQYAVVHLRLEKYKQYCVYYGEEQGEELLEQIYKTLKKSVKRREILAHIEGADYAMLLLNEDGRVTNARIEEMLRTLSSLRNDRKLHYSVGVAPVQDSRDTMMYYNEAGVARGTIDIDSDKRIAWFNDELKAEKIWEQTVENDMDRALANKEFQVYLQPKYSTGDEVLSGAEALVRWIHPTEGFVAPYKFIPILEKNGFITKLDDYMLTEVSRLQSGWLKEGKKIVPISVNVSRVHFLMEGLATHIASIVDEYDVPHEYIELELTESAFFDDKETLLKTVNEMKELGFHVSMDDFGAGYSSLNSLKELPLDVVKLDAEFFRGSDDYDRADLIVSKTIALAKELGMSIVAEGIETREQVDFLKEQQCDLIQGYYFAKPMPVGDFVLKAFGKPERVENTEIKDVTEEKDNE